MSTPTKFILALGVVVSATTGYGDILILVDDFSVPAGGQSLTRSRVGTTTDTIPGLSSPSLIGSSRLAVLRVTGTGPVIGPLAAARINTTLPDELSYSNAGAVNSLLQLGYNSSGAGLGVDFGLGTDLVFDIDASGNNGTIKAEFFSNPGYTGPSATQVFGIPNGIAAPTLLTVPFSTFLLNGGFNWGDVDSIRFTFDGPAGYDVILDSIGLHAVPEASTWIPALGMMVGAGWLVIGRRRQLPVQA